MFQNFLNHLWIFDGGDDSDLTSAFWTDCDVDVDNCRHQTLGIRGAKKEEKPEENPHFLLKKFQDIQRPLFYFF